MGLIKKQEEFKPQEQTEEISFELLIKDLDDEDPQKRLLAARLLGNYKEASIYLVDRLGKETHPVVRESIISSLASIKDEISIKGLIDCLRSDDAKLRNSAVEALSQLPNEVDSYMKGLIHDKDRDVRIFAANIAGLMNHPKAIYWLIEIVENDEDVNVCGTALNELAELGIEESKEAILKAKERFKNEPYIQFAADLALKRIDNG